MKLLRRNPIGAISRVFWNQVAALALGLMVASWSSIGAQEQSAGLPGITKATNLDSISVRSLRAEPGKASLYEVTFVTADTLAVDAVIIMNFPPAFDLGPLEIAGSSQINGGFKLERKDREVRLRRTGLGDKVPPGKSVSIQLGLIVNPADLNAAHQVSVQLRSSSRLAPATTKNQPVQFITPLK